MLEKQPYLRFLSETTLLRTDEPGALSIRQLPAGAALWSRDLGDIRALAVAADAHLIATLGPGKADVSLRVWDVVTGNAVLERGIDSEAGGLRFDGSGRYLTVTSRFGEAPTGLPVGVSLAVGNHSLRVLDAATLNPVAQFDIGGEIRAIEFQADDAIIAALRVESGAATGFIERHRWRTDDMIAEACRRIPLETAQKQWRLLLPGQAVPTPCASQAAAASHSAMSRRSP